MAQVKNWVASKVFEGESVKDIFAQATEEGVSKFDLVKVALWWLFYKGEKALFIALNYISLVGTVLFAIFLIILLGVLSFVGLGALALVSFIWFPLVMNYAPQRAAHLVTTELEQKKKGYWRGIWNLSYQSVSNFIFCILLKNAWGWSWKYMPMDRRQYYIDATGAELKEMSVDEQVAYYFCNPSSETVKRMSFEAVEELRLQFKDIDDIKNIGDAYEIYVELGKTMFFGSEEMFELLKGYCANEKKKITSKFVGFLLERFLKGEGGETWSRASSLVLLCCEHHTLPDHQLKMLFTSLGREKPIARVAEMMLEGYFKRYTFSDSVISLVISFATDDMADEGKDKNFELLCKIVRRDGLSAELAEKFFAHCDSVQNERMTDILKVRMDCDKVSYSSNNDENRESWKQYCYLCNDLSADAQLRMREWQYDIYRDCGHKLDAEVIYELLVKRLSENDKSYFKKVLEEEMERVTLSDTGEILLMMCPWKREILIPLLAAEKEKDNGIAL